MVAVDLLFALCTLFTLQRSYGVKYCGQLKDEVNHGPRFSIMHGEEVSPPHLWPWIVSLQRRRSLTTTHCGAVLIHKRVLLTAAHCVVRSNSSNSAAKTLLKGNTFYGYAAVHSLKSARKEAYRFRIKHNGIIVHENYSPITKSHDIALIVLKRRDVAIREDGHQEWTTRTNAICLPRRSDEQPRSGDTCVLAGWGETEDGTPSDTLQHGKLKIMHPLQCESQLRVRQGAIDTTMLCAGKNDTLFPLHTKSRGCDGDSGGPLVCLHHNDADTWVLAGLLSKGGVVCGDAPNVFVNVSYFQPWIERKLKQLEIEEEHSEERYFDLPQPSPEVSERRYCGLQWEEYQTAKGLILHGQEVKNPHYWPWLVSLLRKTNNRQREQWKHRCGGVLIHDSVVLTAAHCVTDHKKNILRITELQVLTGAHYVGGLWPREDGDNGDVHERRILVHDIRLVDDADDYSEGAADIALVKLRGPGTMVSKARTICLPTEPGDARSANEICIAAGWGFSGTNGSGILREAQFIISPQKRCEEEFKNTAWADHLQPGQTTTFCAGFPEPTCDGDSGGPLMCTISGDTWLVSGVINGGSNRCKQKSSVFANVTTALPWIKARLKYWGYELPQRPPPEFIDH